MMVKISHINTVLIMMITGLTLSYQACSPGQGMRFKSGPGHVDGWVGASGGTTTDNPKPTTSLVIDGFPEGGAKSADIRLCVEEVRFRNSDDEYRFDLDPQWVILNSEGTVIEAALSVPFGNYSRIELRLSSGCTGYSVSVTNSHGTFRTAKELEVRFSGEVTVDGPSSRLVLDMGSMIRDLMQADEREEVEEALTNSEGSCGHQ